MVEELDWASTPCYFTTIGGMSLGLPEQITESAPAMAILFP